MKINIGAKVECRGERAGTIKRLILDPDSFDLRQLVVAHGGFLTAREIIVPVRHIHEAKEEIVILDLTMAEMEALPDFAETVYISLDRFDRDPNAQPPSSYIEPALASFYFIPRFPLPDPPPTLATETVKHIAPGACEIKAGMEVYAGEHKVGEISEVIVDSCDKRATGFVIERGWLFTHNVEVPADWVSSIEGGRIQLNRTRQQIEALDDEQHRTPPSGGAQSAV
jgi:sporulation protein YlmC with PRC-barrel domain